MRTEPSQSELIVELLEGLQRQLNHKWAPRVLSALSAGPLRFGELRAAVTSMADDKIVGESVLAKTLHDLKKYGLVSNTQDDSAWPIIVSTYALTAHARESLPELLAAARRLLTSPDGHAGSVSRRRSN